MSVEKQPEPVTYEWIKKWHFMTGSGWLYVQEQIERAHKTNAPANAIFERYAHDGSGRTGKWATIEDITNADTRRLLGLPPRTAPRTPTRIQVRIDVLERCSPDVAAALEAVSRIFEPAWSKVAQEIAFIAGAIGDATGLPAADIIDRSNTIRSLFMIDKLCHEHVWNVAVGRKDDVTHICQCGAVRAERTVLPPKKGE